MGGVPPGASAGRQALINVRTRRRLARDSVVHVEGDAPEHAWYVHEGLVKLQTTASDGSTVLVAFRGPGDWLGEHAVVDGLPRMTTAIVACDAMLTAIHRDEFMAAVRDAPEFGIELLTAFSGHVRVAVGHELELTSLDPPALVARRLQMLVADPRFAPIRRERDGAISIAMPLSHEELASWAGVSRRSVEAALHDLRAAGAISTGRMRIDVHDTGALERCATGEHRRAERQPAPA